MQKFKLIDLDGREVELEVREPAPVFPYDAMRDLAKEHKLQMYRIEEVR